MKLHVIQNKCVQGTDIDLSHSILFAALLIEWWLWCWFWWEDCKGCKRFKGKRELQELSSKEVLSLVKSFECFFRNWWWVTVIFVDLYSVLPLNQMCLICLSTDIEYMQHQQKSLSVLNDVFKPFFERTICTNECIQGQNWNQNTQENRLESLTTTTIINPSVSIPASSSSCCCCLWILFCRV